LNVQQCRVIKYDNYYERMRSFAFIWLYNGLMIMRQ